MAQRLDPLCTFLAYDIVQFHLIRPPYDTRTVTNNPIRLDRYLFFVFCRNAIHIDTPFLHARYNITPWSSPGNGGRVRLFYSDDDPDGEADEDEDEEKSTAFNAVATVFGGLTPSALVRQGRRITDMTFSRKSNSSATSSPSGSSSDKEKLQLDIAALRKQYARLRERQKQAHVMFWTVAVTSASTSASKSVAASVAAVRRGSASSIGSASVIRDSLGGRQSFFLIRFSFFCNYRREQIR